MMLEEYQTRSTMAVTSLPTRIVVSISYRISALGFLALETSGIT
jgi:carboxylesterase type B